MAPSSLTCSRIMAWALAAVLLQIVGLSLFVIGFFPVKPTLPGFSGPESFRMPTCNADSDSKERELAPDELRSLYREMSEIPPVFDRLILLVVDGLPAEFVLGKGDRLPAKAMMEAMPYTQSLLANGRAIAYHAKAAPPTVTMPRLKAIVSGAIGGFLDVAFNFNTQALLDDNLLDQFHSIGWKLVMHGDDTWVRLFPGLFIRQDGVSSFYVKDTIEVDFNVSRHLVPELVANDWNLLILHYLGLDHVGHIGGRRSNLMAPKLKEMDEVIEMIYMHKILQQDYFDRRTLLVVVSDHGMTDSGNHGGSSYEETDSLALFIGLGTKVLDYIAIAHNAVFQVDIVPTLALLFGVPIPKNNVGVFLAESLDLLTDEQKLRALELNSWQLLRLLQAHLPSLLCGDLNCIVSDVEALESDGSVGSIKKKLCHLLSRALVAHKLWERRHSSGLLSNNTDDIALALGSYYDFLRNASEWLSLKATDKPISLLLPGIIIMLISSVLLFNLLFCLLKEVQFSQKYCCPHMKKCSDIWHLDEAFVVLGILLHVLSLGASSMVEEEQYTWNFLTSTLYLIFLLATLQSLLKERASGSIKMLGVENCTFCQPLGSNTSDGAMFTNYGLEKLNGMREYCYQISSIIVVLICGRILRCWHQGGVNWTHLPDISKWLEQTGTFSIKLFQIITLIVVMILSSIALCLIKSSRTLVLLILSSHIVSGLLVFLHIMERQCNDLISVDHNSTLLVQICYITLGMTTLVAVIASPWTLPVDYCKTRSVTNAILDSDSLDTQIDSLLLGIRDSTYLMGLTSTSSWCLLQLLLQQPINAVPILLIFLQILASIFCFATSESHHGQWVEIAAIYFVGMTGHYGLGNSNSLATIDVAGAFIGISSYSTVLSGILMFIITYGSPMLSFLSLAVYIPMKKTRYTSDPKKSKLGCVLKTMIALPCVLPLVLNSLVLTVFSIILLLMRNHLFVWSVFSPKFLYNCAATVNVFIGVCIIAAMGVYVCTVFFFRAEKTGSSSL